MKIHCVIYKYVYLWQWTGLWLRFLLMKKTQCKELYWSSMSGAAVTSGNIEMALEGLSAHSSPHSISLDKVLQLNNAPCQGTTTDAAHPRISGCSSLWARESLTQASHNLPGKLGGHPALCTLSLSTWFLRVILGKPACLALASFLGLGVDVTNNTCQSICAVTDVIKDVNKGWKVTKSYFESCSGILGEKSY